MSREHGIASVSFAADRVVCACGAITTVGGRPQHLVDVGRRVQVGRGHCPVGAGRPRRATRGLRGHARVVRDGAIRAAYRDGLTQRELAERYGLTRARISQILGLRA